MDRAIFVLENKRIRQHKYWTKYAYQATRVFDLAYACVCVY
jgi:hypothetical protein